MLKATPNLSEKKGRPVLITGCSSGIGLATSNYLSRYGYEVIASVRNAEDIELFNQHNIKCIHLDLTDESSIDSAIDYIQTEIPTLYGLINNGAYGQPGAIEDLTRDALHEQFDTNVFGTHSLTQKLIPLFRRNNAGRIIQISSVLGFIGLPMRGAYNASKYALEGLSDTLRIELLNTNIKVSIIQPGPIESKFRPNAYRSFVKHIDAENSIHTELYKQVEGRLNRKENARFTLPAEAVAKCALHALDSKRPKTRYRVTTPTIILAILKWALPTKLLDRFISKQGG